MTRLTKFAFPLAAAVVVVACGDDATGPGFDDAAVNGQVQETSDPQSTSSAPATSAASPQRTASQPEAETVVVGAVQADGSLDVLAEAEVEADGSFRVEDVPAGRADLVVVARSEAGADVGRVLIHGETGSGAEIEVEPIDASTTVRGRVHAELHASGRSDAARTSGELALFLRLDDATADAVVASGTQIQAMADAYAEAQATMTAVLAESGSDLDAEARAELFAGLAADYAASVNAGADAGAAFETYADAALDALVEAGATAEALALATAGHATASSKVVAEAGIESDVGLELAQTASRINLRARERAAAEIDAGSSLSAVGQQVESELASARADIRLLGILGELSTELEAAFTSSQDVATTAIVDLAGLSGEAETDLEAALDTAFASANLAVALDGSASASGIAGATGTYRAEVEAQASSVVDAMAESDAEVSVEAMAAILIAAGAGADVS